MASTLHDTPERNIPVQRISTTTPMSGVTSHPGLAAWSLGYREWLRFVRQRNRVIGAIGQPVIFWVFLSAGLQESFTAAGTSDVQFLEYFFPGTMMLIVLFTAIFTTISVIEDRREGFMQSVLVAPIPRFSLVAGKLAGGASLAMAQAVVFLALGLIWGMPFPALGLLAGMAFLLICAVALTGLGFILAWRMDSVQGFHAVMSVFLIPMWLLSGAFFPASNPWLAWVMAVNPMTYLMAGFRWLLYLGSEERIAAGTPGLAVSLLVSFAFCAVMFWASCRIAQARVRGDVRS
ncbi:MAG: ABC transporter permease [Pirellulales bacterium]|nr:ABC transporter permease [Pirellulales bacterium]